MNKIKTKKTSKKIILVLLLIFIGIGNVFAENWDSDTIEIKSKSWEESIEKWDELIESWDEKREKMREESYEDFERDAEGCYNGECWKEDLFELSISKNSSSWVEFRKSSCDIEGKIKNGDFWECSNSGQSLEFRASTGEKWESSNHGQYLFYMDSAGNKWESSNHGQSIEFSGINGEKWESSNHGQTIDVIENGKKWRGSRDDTKDDF